MIVNPDPRQIPRIIWQTAKSTPHPKAVAMIDTWKIKNSNYVLSFMDDIQCDQFIKDNFSSDFYEMYSSLPLGVMKADVWRVAVVYVYGGIYADIDCECVVPLDNWISDYSLITTVETENGELANFFFAAKPKHPALLSVLNRFIEIYKDEKFTGQIKKTIQNFGQYGFSNGILRYFNINDNESMRKGGTSDYYNTPRQVKDNNARFFTNQEKRITNHIHSSSYVAHYVASENWTGYKSWKKEQDLLFKKTSVVKPIKFITTFSKAGYEVYGKTWIKTFTENVVDKNITADIYVDFDILTAPNINFINFNKVIPTHKNWIRAFSDRFLGEFYNKMMGIRFSYKAFVMMHALENNKDCYVIWLDGDCVFKSGTEYSSLVNVLNGKAIAVQREANYGGEDHCESGIVIFDVDHPNISRLLTQFKTNYEINKIIKMQAPYDGFVLYKSLAGIPYEDLNLLYGKHGIQGDPNETFLHPELKKRFIHNIGPTGKSSYESWKKISETDEFFRLINGHQKVSEIEITQQRNNLINIRNHIKSIPK